MAQNKENLNELGFGSKAAQQHSTRFLNRDGSFNVRRKGRSFFRSLNLYHSLLTMPWRRFNVFVVGLYFGINILFALAYVMCGTNALEGSTAITVGDRFIEAFFFSVQTLATIGYGKMSPATFPAHVVVTFEALIGLSGFALATGILFSRFSRPQAKIIFSRTAVIAPYREGTALMFRVANERTNEIVNMSATVIMSRFEGTNGKTARKYYQLPLELSTLLFFPLSWTVVHPIDDASPFRDVTAQEFERADTEVMILLSGLDETFSQTVHARSSYKHHELVWNAKFSDIYIPGEDGVIAIDLERIHEIQSVTDSMGHEFKQTPRHTAA